LRNKAEDLIEIFCPDVRSSYYQILNILDYHVLKAVFKTHPHQVVTFEAGDLGDRETWEENLNNYITLAHLFDV